MKCREPFDRFFSRTHFFGPNPTYVRKVHKRQRLSDAKLVVFPAADANVRACDDRAKSEAAFRQAVRYMGAPAGSLCRAGRPFSARVDCACFVSPASPAHPGSGDAAACRGAGVRPESFLYRLSQREEKRRGERAPPRLLWQVASQGREGDLLRALSSRRRPRLHSTPAGSHGGRARTRRPTGGAAQEGRLNVCFDASRGRGIGRSRTSVRGQRVGLGFLRPRVSKSRPGGPKRPERVWWRDKTRRPHSGPWCTSLGAAALRHLPVGEQKVERVLDSVTPARARNATRLKWI